MKKKYIVWNFYPYEGYSPLYCETLDIAIDNLRSDKDFITSAAIDDKTIEKQRKKRKKKE